ncbi:nitrogenase-associated protein [Alteromonadaceae bacterium Bs31]|nr:nitrogenase-associated protein [Alteromonadaceae bacterium Bs31]
MAVLIFYEKPGCISNGKQKKLLKQAGIDLVVRDLLSHPWTEQSLKAFFTSNFIESWINPNAPSVKSGEIVPEALDPTTALSLMIKDPLLIRRPLIECQAGKWSGFDLERITSSMGVEGDFYSHPEHEKCAKENDTQTQVATCP